MYYFDVLRVGRALRTFTIALVVWTLVVAVLLPFSHAGHHSFTVGSDNFSMGSLSGLALLHQLGQGITFPFGAFCTFAVGIAIFFSNAMATSLSRYNDNLHFLFTKPVSRERAALITFACDLAGIATATAITLLFVLVPFAEVGLLNRIAFESAWFLPIPFGIGIAFMWYGLVQAVTATLRGGAGLVLGLSYAVFGVLQALQNLNGEMVPDPIVAAIHAINLINPFIYFGKLVSTHGDSAQGMLDAGYLQNLGIVWGVAIVALAIAIVLRKRMEV